MMCDLIIFVDTLVFGLYFLTFLLVKRLSKRLTGSYYPRFSCDSQCPRGPKAICNIWWTFSKMSALSGGGFLPFFTAPPSLFLLARKAFHTPLTLLFGKKMTATQVILILLVKCLKAKRFESFGPLKYSLPVEKSIVCLLTKSSGWMIRTAVILKLWYLVHPYILLAWK